MKLFLVCAHTHELVPCGNEGRGYEFERFQKWVHVSFGVVRFALQVTSAALAAVPVGHLTSSVLDGVGEQVVAAAISGILGQLEMLSQAEHDGKATNTPHKEVCMYANSAVLIYVLFPRYACNITFY